MPPVRHRINHANQEAGFLSYGITAAPPDLAPGTPGIFSILETFKRHKRQTATERDKCTLLI